MLPCGLTSATDLWTGGVIRDPLAAGVTGPDGHPILGRIQAANLAGRYGYVLTTAALVLGLAGVELAPAADVRGERPGGQVVGTAALIAWLLRVQYPITAHLQGTSIHISIIESNNENLKMNCDKLLANYRLT